MIVGIDLDNTIIKYDNAFIEAAKFLNINIPACITNKIELKKHCNSLNEGELIWQKIQGLAYGKLLLKNAKLYTGVKRFIWRLKNKGHKIYVVPESKVYHVGGGTLDYMSPFKTYLKTRLYE